MADDCNGVHAQVDVYLAHVRDILDAYEAGEISRSEAVQQHSAYWTDVTSTAVDAFVTRIMDRAAKWRTPESALDLHNFAVGNTYVHRAHHPHANQGPTPSSTGPATEPEPRPRGETGDE
jgi:hypothetical protein